jgi:hypothetical protein
MITALGAGAMAYLTGIAVVMQPQRSGCPS